MDPNATLQLWRDATTHVERTEAREHLREWLRNGGFAPEWRDVEEWAAIVYSRPHKLESMLETDHGDGCSSSSCSITSAMVCGRYELAGHLLESATDETEYTYHSLPHALFLKECEAFNAEVPTFICPACNAHHYENLGAASGDTCSDCDGGVIREKGWIPEPEGGESDA